MPDALLDMPHVESSNIICQLAQFLKLLSGKVQSKHLQNTLDLANVKHFCRRNSARTTVEL